MLVPFIFTEGVVKMGKIEKGIFGKLSELESRISELEKAVGKKETEKANTAEKLKGSNVVETAGVKK